MIPTETSMKVSIHSIAVMAALVVVGCSSSERVPSEAELAEMMKSVEFEERERHEEQQALNPASNQQSPLQATADSTTSQFFPSEEGRNR